MMSCLREMVVDHHTKSADHGVCCRMEMDASQNVEEARGMVMQVVDGRHDETLNHRRNILEILLARRTLPLCHEWGLMEWRRCPDDCARR